MSRRSKQAPAFGPRLPFLILSAFVCAYGFSIEPAPDIKRIQDRGELVVAMFREDVYPLFYTDERGTLRGHEVDLAKEIASTLGVGLRIDRSAATFDGVVDIVGKGEPIWAYRTSA